MKTPSCAKRTRTATIRQILAGSVAALLAAHSVQATVYYWDVNGTAAGFSTVVGGWTGTNIFWNTDATGGNSGTTTATTTSADDLIIAQATTNTGSITVTGTQNASSITFAANVGPTVTITGGTIVIGGSGASSGIFQQSTGANTISTALTLNSTVSAFNFSNTNAGTGGLLTIGAVTGAASSGTQTITVGTDNGGGITLGGVIGNGANGGNVALNINSSGAGITTLSGASTFTGGVTMTAGTASFTSTGLGSGKITFAGNSTLQWGASTTTDLSSRLIINTGVTATLDTGANNVTFASVFGLENNSKGTLNKIGSGTLTLSNAANQFAGNIVITNGKVALGNQYGMWQSAYDTTGSTGAIGLDVTGRTTPWLGGVAGSVNLAAAITGYGSVTSLTLNPQSGSSVSYGGVIANGAANMTLNKTGFGTQTLTNTNTYSGATTVWAGTLALSGASGTAQNSAFSVLGGTLLLDNTTALADRLNNSTALSLGSLTLKSNTAAGTQAETVGATTFAVGGKVTVDLNGGTAQTTLAMGTVTRSAGAAIDFVGVGGTLGGGASSPNVTTTGTFPGGSNGILPWATVNGTTWAGTASTTSIVAYAGTFVDPTSAASAAASNAQLTGSGTMNAVKSFNSLNVISSGASQSFDLSTAGVLTLTSGGILKSGTNAYTISGSAANAITPGTELIAHVNGGALTISAPLNTAIVNLAKGGTGDLILSGARAATLSGAISIAGGQLEFQGASTTISGAITGAGGLTVNLNAGQTLTMSNLGNSYSGPTIVKGGYLANSGYQNVGLPGGNYQTPTYQSGANNNTSLAGTNLVLQGGIYIPAYTFNKDLGAGPNQVQILAGTSGFVHVANSGGATGFVLDSGRELVWGSTYFNPTAFVFSTVNGANITVALANGFDLNGSTRTVMVGDATYNGSTTGGVSQLSGAIRTSSGTAGLTKTGPGLLLLTGSSTYNGATTVSAGTLSFQGNANVASANPLGQSSAAAANLLLANGTTLQYSGTTVGATDRGFTINGTAIGDGATLDASGTSTNTISFTNTASPAYGTVDQARSLTLTGSNTSNNTLAANIADNGAGAVSVTKTGAGLWVLSGTTSSYTGPTTITAGTLSVSATANLGNATSSLVFNGGTLQITNTTNLPNFSTIGHTVVFNSGKTVGLDISSGTFTVDQVLNQGTGGLTKAGAGTLLINSAQTYTGFTTISAGTLRIDSGGSIPGPIINNSIYLINQNATTGTAPLTNISGSGSIAVGTGFTITINPGNGLSFNALNTTGGGSFALSGAGVTTPTLGGLVGTTGNLSSAFSSGYTGVTNLTLNTVSGSSFTYGGVIADGAAGMTLTKSGAGTQVLYGANTYTGNTIIRGGALTLDYSQATANNIINNVTNSSALVMYGGQLNASQAASPTTSRSQRFNGLFLNAGDNTIVPSNYTSPNPKILITLGAITRTGNSTVQFFAPANTLGADNGITTSTANDPTFGILGAWAISGNANSTNSADWAINNGTNVTALAAASYYTTTTGGNTAANYANKHMDVTSSPTFTGAGTISPYTMRFVTSGAATVTLDAGTNIVQAGGILETGKVGNYATAINGGNLTGLGSGTGELIVYQGNTVGSSLTIGSNIVNNGATNTVLVKSGNGSLTLGGTSTFTGGLVINGGTLLASADANLGATVASANLIGAAQAITVNGNTTLGLGSATYNRSISIASGANVFFSNQNTPTITGAVTGAGSISTNGGNAASSITLSSTSNTFTGGVTIGTNSGSSTGPTLNIASLADSLSPGAGNIIFNYGYSGTTALFSYMSTAVAPLTLNNRQIVVANTSAGVTSKISNQNTTNAITINTNLSVTTSTAGTHTLNLDAVAGPVNAFNGTISDGWGGVFIAVSKTSAGTWVLGGNNTYTGGTTITGGTLTVSTIGNAGVAGNLGQASNAAANLVLNGGTLQYTGGAQNTDRLFSLQASSAIDSSGAGALNFTNTGAMGFNGGTAAKTLTLTGTNTGANTIAASIGDNTGATSLTKNGNGTWVLSGANTNSGTATINIGTLTGTQTSGTPFGTGAVTIGAGTLSLAPTGSGADVAVTGGNVANTNNFTYNADAIFSLNKGSNNSLTYTFSRTNAAVGLARGTNGTLILSVGAIGNLGNTVAGGGERFLITAAATPVTLVNNLVSGVVAQDRGNSNAGDFVTYGNTNGFAAATPDITNTFTGSTNAKYVSITNPSISTGAAVAAYALKVSGQTLTNTSTLTLGGSATGVAGLILNNATISGGTSLTTPTSVATELAIYTSGTSVISTPILTATSQAGVSVFGPGTLDLSSSTGNTFTGGLRVNNTTLIVNNNNQLGAAASTVTLTGGTLQTSGATTEINFNGGASYHGYTLNAGQNQTGGTFNVTGGTTTLTNTGGVIGGSGSLTKTGAGTFVLTGTVTNTYTGGTIVNNGTLQLGASNMLADTGAVTVGGGTFDLQTFSDTVGAVTLTSGSIIGSGGTLTGTSYDVRNGAASANLAGSGAAMTKTTSGTVTLSGTNSFTGMTTVSAGTLQFAKMVSLYNNTPASWTAANINVKSGATLALNVDSAGSAGFDSTNLNTLLTNISVASGPNSGLQAGAILGFDTSTATGATFTQGNVIANSTGANGGMIGVTKLGTGTLVFNQANTYTGGTTVSAGTLQVANATALGGSAGAVSVTGGAVLDLNGTTMTGTNALTLNGTGISNGGALVNSSGPAGTYAGNVALGSASSIGGIGAVTLSGTLNLAGHTLIIKNGGTVNLNGALTASDGTLDAEAGTTNVNAAIGTGSSVVYANATTNFTTSQTLGSLNIGVTDPNPNTLAPDFTGGLAAAAAPEPGSISLLLVGALGLAGRRRRCA